MLTLGPYSNPMKIQVSIRSICNLLLVCIFFMASCSERKTPADLIIKGGTIYTVDERRSLNSAVGMAVELKAKGVPLPWRRSLQRRDRRGDGGA